MSKKGWVCPQCNRVFAPWVAECRFCSVKIETSIGPFDIDFDGSRIIFEGSSVIITYGKQKSSKQKIVNIPWIQTF